jgi:hypothetical protein
LTKQQNYLNIKLIPAQFFIKIAAPKRGGDLPMAAKKKKKKK